MKKLFSYTLVSLQIFGSVLATSMVSRSLFVPEKMYYAAIATALGILAIRNSKNITGGT